MWQVNGGNDDEMEEIGLTFPEYQPLQVLWCLFVRPHPMNHPFPPDSLIT